MALKSSYIKSQIDATQNGAAREGLNFGQISKLALTLPSNEEQQAIVVFLDRETAKIDALIAEQQKFIELLKEKRQAVISHAVTKGLDPNAPMKDSAIEWLGEVPEHWAIAALSYRYDVALGKMLDEKKITGNHLAPYLRNADVQWGKINIADLPEMDFLAEDIQRFSLRKGDLLVCEGGEVGRAAIWNQELEECFYQKALHRLRPKSPSDENPAFLFYHLFNAAFSGRFSGSEGKSTIAHLTAEALRRYQFCFPPFGEQSAIAAFLDQETTKLDALTAEAQRATELLKERRAALISAAVTGKIDVRGFAQTAETLPIDERTQDIADHASRNPRRPSRRALRPSVSRRTFGPAGRDEIGIGYRGLVSTKTPITPMNLHREIHFEAEICEHLAAHGWHYAEGDAAHYDRARVLFPADVLAWVQATQPDAWKTLAKNHGPAAVECLLARLRDALNKAGTLDVLRFGIDLIGLRQPLALAQFKPALALNPHILARYAANRLRVVRQVRYSLHTENALDLVLFLNGIPVATAELKSDFTQSVEDAVDQYRQDRDPRPKGQTAAEPLLSFPSGALVHFAVSQSEARMATRLEGPATQFLPFNRGNHGAAGNPPNEHGPRTAYLWRAVWERESWLDILGRYLVAHKDSKQQIKRIIFPRFHQLDSTRALLKAVLAEGPGGKYLIQHSAGSGKTNSIAWTAHALADLHDAQHDKLFATVLVVSDRTVLDAQLQEAIFDFERTAGVVATIKGDAASKSGELAEALAGGKKIVVCTIQTFPFALRAVRELAATQGKRFAVIADEAHSSQTGDAAAKLKAVLSAEEWQDLADGGEISTEDLLAAQMAARAEDNGITYVAFTATPKAKTLELFGRRPRPDLPAGPGNLPEPFHVYSMRQAIEEGFILDVLRNYTPYKLAFKLAHDGQELDERRVARDEALKGILRWVKLHPYNISQKVQVVVEHYRAKVLPLLGGRAKAMVVVSSRLEAVRWKLAMEHYIRDKNYETGVLVAFSGEVKDSESGPDPFTETSPSMNPALKGRGIREAFDTDGYHILLVANKFQTGFDQALLCGMYVDKRLAGIAAVQTLSRLNRAHPGKDTTYILDFVNDPDDILAAFKTYYATAELDGVTDPNLVFDLRMKLDAAGHYDEFEINRVVAVELDPKAKHSDLAGALEPVVSRLLQRYKAAQARRAAAQARGDTEAADAAKDELNALILFKHDLGAFQRMYAFLSQIFDYGNTAIEKRFIFFKRLLPLLEFGREREGVDLSKLVLTHHSLRSQGRRAFPLGEGGTPKLAPLAEAGGGAVQDKEKVLLDELIAKVNDLFEGDLTENDRLVYVNRVILGKLLESSILVQQAANNTKEQFANSPDLTNELMNAIIDAFAAHSAMSRQALDSERVRQGLREILLGPARLYEALRDKAEQRRAG